MKNIQSIFLVIFSIASLHICAQDMESNREKIKELKIAYFTEKLDLSIEEAKLFWPTFNKYRKAQFNIMEEICQTLHGCDDLANITDTEAEKIIKENLELEKKILEEKEEFIKKLSSFLPFSKILKFQLAEREFGRKLLRKYKKNNNRNK